MSNKNLSEKTVSGGFWLVTGSGAQAFLRLLFMMVLSRLLTPEDFAVVAIVTLVIGFSDLFVQLGVGPALVKTPHLSSEHIRTGFTFSLVTGVVTSILVYMATPSIVKFFNMPELEWAINTIAWTFAFNSIAKIAYALLEREMEFKKLAGRDALSYLIAFGFVGIPLAILGYGYKALVLAFALKMFLYSILIYIKSSHKISVGVNWLILRELLSYGKHHTLVNMLNYFAQQVDYFVIGKMMPSSALGYYNRAYQIMDMSNSVFGSAVPRVLFAGFSKIQGNQEKIRIALTNSYAVVFAFFIPMGLYSSIFADEIVYLLLGTQWLQSVPLLKILSLFMVFRIGQKVGGAFARSNQMIVKSVYVQLAYLVLVASLTYLGSFYSLTIVALLVSLALVLSFLLQTKIVMDNSDYQWRILAKDFFRAIAGHLPLAALAWGLAQVMRAAGWHELLILGLIGACLAVLYLLLIVRYPAYLFGAHTPMIMDKFINKALVKMRLKKAKRKAQ